MNTEKITVAIIGCGGRGKDVQMAVPMWIPAHIQRPDII